MRNYLIGLFTGIGAGCLYYANPSAAWYLWILFIAGVGLASFGLDAFFGSFEEHQPRAAWMGLTLFGGPGAVLLVLVWLLAF